MRWIALIALLAGTASADPPMLLQSSAQRVKRVDFDGACKHLMSAAGVGISSGKLVLMRHAPDGHREVVAVDVGNARMMPLFDLSTGHASALVRFTF